MISPAVTRHGHVTPLCFQTCVSARSNSFHSSACTSVGHRSASWLQSPDTVFTFNMSLSNCLLVKWQQLPNEFPFITSTLSQDQLTAACAVCFHVSLCPFAVTTVYLADKNLDILSQINLVGVRAHMCVLSWVYLFWYMPGCLCVDMHGHVKEGFLF